METSREFNAVADEEKTSDRLAAILGQASGAHNQAA
jgi:hypothetical protein